MAKKNPEDKAELKAQALLSRELGNPQKRLFSVFLLIGVIPVLALLYILRANLISHNRSLAEIGPVLFFTSVIMVLGSATGYGIVRQILRRILAYAAQAKRGDEIKSSFAMSLAHDLKSPLLIIKANISNLKAGFLGALTPKQEETINVCRDVADRMDSLIMDLIETYKIEARIAEPAKDHFDLREALKEQMRECEAIAESKKISLSGEFGPKTLSFVGDRRMILRALHNLLSNALKFTPANGRVTLKASSEGGFGIIECHNTGPSIPRDKLEKIFDKFERLEGTEEGQGLGLAITKDIVEIHQGRVWATSGAWEPNCFTILLPLDTK
jgi:signal transduction histidine kinase